MEGKGGLYVPPFALRSSTPGGMTSEVFRGRPVCRLVKVNTEEERQLAAEEDVVAEKRRAAVAARFAKAAQAAKLRAPDAAVVSAEGKGQCL